jgi:hypothetical protein
MREDCLEFNFMSQGLLETASQVGSQKNTGIQKRKRQEEFGLQLERSKMHVQNAIRENIENEHCRFIPPFPFPQRPSSTTDTFVFTLHLVHTVVATV